MAHRGIWLAATACLVAGLLAAPPGSEQSTATRAQVAADTGYQPSGEPPVVRPGPPAFPAPAEPAPPTRLPVNPPAVPDLVAPAPRPTTRPVTTSVTRPVTRPQPNREETAKPKPPKPKPPKPTVPPKPPVKPRPSIPRPQPGPPDTHGATTWQGKLISRTTPDGKTALAGSKPRTRG